MKAWRDQVRACGVSSILQSKVELPDTLAAFVNTDVSGGSKPVQDLRCRVLLCMSAEPVVFCVCRIFCYCFNLFRMHLQLLVSTPKVAGSNPVQDRLHSGVVPVRLWCQNFDFFVAIAVLQILSPLTGSNPVCAQGLLQCLNYAGNGWFESSLGLVVAQNCLFKEQVVQIQSGIVAQCLN